MTNVLSDAPDPRALRILFDTFWTSAGWRKERQLPSTDDLATAKRAGLMFDPVELSHDAVVARGRLAASAVDREAVADAFVISMLSRRLELRSALGSYAVLQHFPVHVSDSADRCSICGIWNETELSDLNVLNFERFKWGGVRHDNPIYAGFDLELFTRLPRAIPEAADIAAFKTILDAIEQSPGKTTATALEKHLSKAIRSSKPERQQLIGILGLCGILATQGHRGFVQRFVNYSERELPPRHFVDMAYPACWWKRSDGLNQEALTFWFGHIL